jgi:hypothetical protein
MLREQPQMADAVIARLCETTDKTAARIRNRLVLASEIPNLNYRVGADGKSYPAAKPTTCQEPIATSLADNEFCPCGGRWMSDGEGGRFCERCKADFPVMSDDPMEDMQVESGSGSDGMPVDEGPEVKPLFEATFQAFDVLCARVEALERRCDGRRLRATLNKLGAELRELANAL